MRQDVIECIEDEFDTHGIDAMNPKKKIGNYARPRKFEVCFSCRSDTILTAFHNRLRRPSIDYDAE